MKQPYLRLAMGVIAMVGATGTGAVDWSGFKDQYAPDWRHASYGTDRIISDPATIGYSGDFGVMRSVVPSSEFTPLQMDWQPPSMDAGCGGINLNLGSFNVLASADVSQLIEDIPQQAIWYAASLAMDALSPPAKNAIESIKSTLNDLNMDALNSCEAAQALVRNDYTNSAWNRLEQFGRNAAGEPGHQSDQPTLSDDDVDALIADLSGNIVFKILDVSYSRSEMGDDDFERTLNLALATIGTHGVMMDVIRDSSGVVLDTEENPLYVGPNTLTLDDFVFGFQDAMAPVCANTPTRREDVSDPDERPKTASEQCIEIELEPMTWDSLKEDVRTLYKGEPGNPGVLQRMRDNASGSLTADEQDVMAMIDPAIRRQIEDLVIASGGDNAAYELRHVVNEISGHIAYESMYVMLNDLFSTVKNGVTAALQAGMRKGDEDGASTSGTQNTEVLEKLLDNIAAAERSLENQYASFRESEGSMSEKLVTFNELLRTLQRQRQFMVQDFNRAR